jgi:hypothetical protein
VFLDFGRLGFVNDSIVDFDELDWTSFLFLSGNPVQESLLGIIGGWFYHAGLQSSSWQSTPGKCAVGIVLTDVAGDRIPLVNCVVTSHRAAGNFIAGGGEAVRVGGTDGGVETSGPFRYATGSASDQ